MDDKRTVWCGNLAEKVTEEILYELFLQAGPLERISIPKDKYGKQRSYGFVTFKHECSVPYCLSLFKGTCLYKRPLNLQSRHNANTDAVHQGFGFTNLEGSERQRTQSVPINFGASTPAPQDYDMLLQLGQQMLLPGMMGFSPFYSPGGLYASQMSSLHVLGGQFHDMRTPKSSLDGHGSSRNHPYYRGGGGSGDSHNHSSNGRHNKSNSNNSRHRHDAPRSSDKRRH